MAAAMVSPVTLLRLGRVSNLPTVWTNVLAATVLAGGAWQNARIGLVLVAMSLFYVGGMYLNDYFDRAIDARERPGRPIPAGDITANAVAAAGFGMLFAGVVLLAATGVIAAVMGLVLAALIVAYNLFHKGVALSPVTMGLCRAFVYFGAAAAVAGQVSWPVAARGPCAHRLCGRAHLCGAAGKPRPRRQSLAAGAVGRPDGAGAARAARGRVGARHLPRVDRLERLCGVSAGETPDAGRGAACGRRADRRHLAGRCRIFGRDRRDHAGMRRGCGFCRDLVLQRYIAGT